MTRAPDSGSSIVETLVALALVVSVSAALLPAVALAARLQQESAIETEAAVIAASRLESLRTDTAGGGSAALGAGGALDARRDGWHAFVDRDGAAAPPGAAAYECRWQAAPAWFDVGLLILSVRVIPAAGTIAPVTIAAAVPDG